MGKYIFRLEDICETMNWRKFERLKNLFFQYEIKPILSIIPQNRDEILNIDPPNPNFWQEIRELVKKGWKVAMHGFEHKYINQNGGILKINFKSEFAGLSYEDQLEKIKKGKEILKSQNIETDIFVAPGHSFDKNTLKALKEVGFKVISDGIALYPFEKYGILWIPQIAWRPKKFRIGLITFCLHPNFMEESDFEKLEKFLKENKKNIGKFDDFINWYKNQGVLGKFFTGFLNLFFMPIWYFRYSILKMLIKHADH